MTIKNEFDRYLIRHEPDFENSSRYHIGCGYKFYRQGHPPVQPISVDDEGGQQRNITRDPDSEISQAIQAIGKGMYNQRRSIILAIPEIFGIKDVKDGQWRYVRIKFKLWPGQINIIEETFKQRVVQLLTKSYADYASWMITVTYKVE